MRAVDTSGVRTARYELLQRLKTQRLDLQRVLSASALRTMQATGIFSVAANSQRRSSRLLILCYHGISLQDEHECWPHLYIPLETFRDRLRSLRDSGAAVLPLDEALIRLQLGSLPKRSVAITFDDGFYDFLRHAVPALADFGLPCTLYLTTHYCDYRVPVISLILDYVLWKSGKGEVCLPTFGIEEPVSIRESGSRQQVVKHLLSWAVHQGMSTAGKNETVWMLANQLGVDYQSILDQRILQLMSADEVQQISQAGIDIQLHTHRHRVPRNYELFRREIEENRRRILDFTGKSPTHFCYPSGEYAPEFFAWLEECGVKSATTCESGLASIDSASMQLPRVLDDCGMSAVRFDSTIAGLFL